MTRVPCWKSFGSLRIFPSYKLVIKFTGMVNLLAVLQVKAEGIQGVAILLVGQGEEVD